MFNQPIRNLLEQQKFLTASPDTTVYVAAEKMASRRVGALLVVENERLVGIVTERDVLFRVVAQGRDASRTRICEVMSAAPITLAPDKSYGHALLLMQVNGFRHIPVVENDRPIGIISSRSAMDPDLEEFTSEARRREYYR
ncbi:MAG: CBS domain-containing protein [Rhodoferax sp.]|uniref:CBS domain-containing protein n=1 Tax=Rhodoferax sp. TaxID=50421 RepID=UPI00301AB6B5